MQLKSRKTYILKNPSYFKYCAFFFNLYAVTQRQLLMLTLMFDVDIDVVDAALEPQSQPMFGALLWEYSVRAGL